MCIKLPKTQKKYKLSHEDEMEAGKEGHAVRLSRGSGEQADSLVAILHGARAIQLRSLQYEARRDDTRHRAGRAGYPQVGVAKFP
ncbi:hypothetical protein BRADI_1g55835v3 [Brachypodium distachyon]|uniref:Uncharacterized protein n=1 Tax=Brachypodium distachyon TaxID=15368 RepID=A0A0Q3LC31_BRADI|nr:hypothetical protein BRADI_1g55835v3 [Brachypodium distachyon]